VTDGGDSVMWKGFGGGETNSQHDNLTVPSITYEVGRKGAGRGTCAQPAHAPTLVVCMYLGDWWVSVNGWGEGAAEAYS
jgi:hypothetical protein